MRNGNLDELAAEACPPFQDQRFGFERHSIDDEAPAGTKREDATIEDARIARPASDKDGLRWREVFERSWRCALDHNQPGHAERSSVALDAGGALRVSLDGNRAQGCVGEHPFNRDRACARANVP